jgi:predicted SprT family Zn-dependent metalloprotease
MDVEEAAGLARRLMDEHGLRHWQFRWDRARRRFGCCWQSRLLITLSRPLTALNDPAEVRDTLLHEIAHALVPGGHTDAWRHKCVQIGARPHRCYSSQHVKLPEIARRFRFLATCGCRIEHVRRRKPTRSYICRRCRQPLVWARQAIAPPPAVSVGM